MCRGNRVTPRRSRPLSPGSLSGRMAEMEGRTRGPGSWHSRPCLPAPGLSTPDCPPTSSTRAEQPLTLQTCPPESSPHRPTLPSRSHSASRRDPLPSDACAEDSTFLLLPPRLLGAPLWTKPRPTPPSTACQDPVAIGPEGSPQSSGGAQAPCQSTPHSPHKNAV